MTTFSVQVDSRNETESFLEGRSTRAARSISDAANARMVKEWGIAPSRLHSRLCIDPLWVFPLHCLLCKRGPPGRIPNWSRHIF